MHTKFKRFLALALCLVMAVSILAACGNKEESGSKSSADEKQQSSGSNYLDNIISGNIVLNAGAIFDIRYNTQGTVDNIVGDNDVALSIMEDFSEYKEKAVADVMKDLIVASAKKDALTEEISTLLIRIESGNVFDGKDARAKLEKAAQEALKKAKSPAIVMIVDSENFTGEGYLNLATIKELILNELGVDKFDEFYGDTLPTNNYYLVTAEVDGIQYAYMVEAFNGTISIASQEDLLGNPDEDLGDEFIDEDLGDSYEEDESNDVPPASEEDGDIEIPID